MSPLVFIKGNRNGIIIMLDNKVSFPELKKELALKFKEAESFFQNASLAITFSGRHLNYAEEKELIDVITDNSSISVPYVQSDNLPAINTESSKVTLPEDSSVGCFYKGTLKNGQILESRKSIIIIGDVEHGARIISGGNITIIGTLNGQAYAGITGNKDAYILAMSMHPEQLRIYDTFADTDDFEHIFLFSRQHIVFMRSEHIIISGIN
ncbi:MAG: septum site-determining protein MinC, partial [Eubacterium sp.]